MTKRAKILITTLLLVSSLFLSIQGVNAASAKHKGRTETKPAGSIIVKRAIGETTWKGKYHYTRAQILTIWGSVDTDSGRVWGKNKTKAVSPWATAEMSRGKTYYGS
ncbi:hypothetical protein [Bacillus mojavensis]|uniref:hypothetical protein n=1 Tax=Bacillus mojavensis TaxID=72360 RepID=UPI0039A4C034